MSEHFALKRLTASDLTLFESLFRRLNAGNQKAINLNADVFVSALYPSARTLVPPMDNEIPLALSVFGPGGKPEHKMARKIIKNPSYKNWRLNGEFIPGPDGDASRYDSMRQGDLAVMSFKGDPTPTGLDLVLIAQDVPADTRLHAALSPLVVNRSMVPLSTEEIAAAISAAGAPVAHPINGLIIDPALEAALEDAALGGERGTRVLLRRRSGRSVTHIDLASARLKADRIGLEGEGLINALLTQRVADGVLAAVEWSSAKNAISPYDFCTHSPASLQVKLDVKSTTGPFENDIHISIAELIEAAEAPERYDLYRVYDLTEEGGKLRIAEDIRTFAKHLLSRLDLPTGVRCDGFSVDVDAIGLTWGTEVCVARPAGDEGDEDS